MKGGGKAHRVGCWLTARGGSGTREEGGRRKERGRPVASKGEGGRQDKSHSVLQGRKKTALKLFRARRQITREKPPLKHGWMNWITYTGHQKTQYKVKRSWRKTVLN